MALRTGPNLWICTRCSTPLWGGHDVPQTIHFCLFRLAVGALPLTVLPQWAGATGDTLAPTLLLFEPNRTPVEANQPWLWIQGDLYDPHLLGLYINGVLVTRQNGPFSHRVRLQNDRDLVQVEALDASQNRTKEALYVIYESGQVAPAQASLSDATTHETEGPKIDLTPDWTRTHYVGTTDYILKGSVEDDDLRFVGVNGVWISDRPGPFEVSLDLPHGPSRIVIAAHDANNHRASTTLNLVVDTQSPQLAFGHAKTSTVYEDRFTIMGFVLEPHLKTLRIYHPGGAASEDPGSGTPNAPRETKQREPARPVSSLEGVYDFDEIEPTEGPFAHPVSLAEGPNTFVVEATDRAGNRQTQPIVLVYRQGQHPPHPPQAPTGLLGLVRDQAVQLYWKAPHALVNGAPIPNTSTIRYAIYRNGEPVGTVSQKTRFEDHVLAAGGRYVYALTAQIEAIEQDHTPISHRSSPVEVVLSDPHSPRETTENGFEAPVVVSESQTSLSHPVAAVTQSSSTTLGHLAWIQNAAASAGKSHLEKSEDLTGSNALIYTRSERAGKAGSWEETRILDSATRSASFTEVALAGRQHQIALAWLKTVAPSPDTPDGAHQLRVSTSTDGGRSFSPPKLVRATPHWKRGLDLAYDRYGNLHLVWGENSKAYYLKNLEGPASNVFDQHHRYPVDVMVEYEYEYVEPCKTDRDCPCTRTVREQYSLAHEPIPPHARDKALGCLDAYAEFPILYQDLKQDPEAGLLFGPYFYRCEENYVVNPSLSVDEDVVTVIAHQRFRWDNFPVKNPQWSKRLGPENPPRNPEARCNDPHQGRRRDLIGFRRTWKKHRAQKDIAHPEGVSDLGPHDYQYLYEGTWHDEDRIVVATRPLVVGDTEPRPSSPPDAQNGGPSTAEAKGNGLGWQQGVWVNHTFQRWRHSVVDRFAGPDLGFEAERPPPKGPDPSLHEPKSELDKADLGAHPQIGRAPNGSFFAVFEKPMAPSPNPEERFLHISRRANDQSAWSTPVPVDTGRMPDLKMTDTGQRLILYSAPSDEPLESDQVWLAQETTGPGHAEKDLFVTKPMGHPRRGHPPHLFARRPSLATLDDFVLAAWVRPQAPFGPDQIVIVRASQDSEVKHLDFVAPQEIHGQKSFEFEVRAENKFHMAVDSAHSVQFETGQERFDVSLKQGEARLFTNLSGLPKPVVASGHAPTVGLHPTVPDNKTPPTTVFGAAAKTSNLGSFDPAGILLKRGAHVLPGNAAGNRARAIKLRDALIRGPKNGGPHTFYQLEYAPDASEAPHAAQDPEPTPITQKAQDSLYLARFERAWIYTQGIALAQFARTQQFDRATGLAQWMCARAVVAPSGQAYRGWPFSENTKEDTWKDARLVTGANAWALHGLGTFISSTAFDRLDSPTQNTLRTCYQNTLEGLKQHRRPLRTPENEDPEVLMTAGWTRLGLTHAQNPSALGLTSDPLEQWAYYDILDALGYRWFDERQPPQIQTYAVKADGKRHPLGVRALSQTELTRLNTPVLATNVVTEHNLDVLHVLNHALLHLEELDLRAEEHALKTWRDTLRQGIFNRLWDQEGWRAHLGDTVSDDLELGRFITGGVFDAEAQNFEPSNHVAIDNCSWLSLSVDYPSLDDTEREKLARCLHYTVLAFAKDLEFGGQHYYGAHYFPNSFKDPYIAPNARQEASYHLEATLGLIQGLDRFSEALPDHEKAPFFQRTALALWGGVQSFVNDHGFPYSSQEIHNLSTRLSSSTAAIWFIDVYDTLQAAPGYEQQPLKNYALGFSVAKAQRALATARTTLVSGARRTPPEGRGVLIRSGFENVKTVTLLEAQALGLIALVNDQDVEHAEDFARGLLCALPSTPGEQTQHNPLPVAVYTDTCEPLGTTDGIQTELMVLYALGWFLTHAQAEAALEAELKTLLKHRLQSLLINHRAPKGTPLEGLFVRGSKASLEDNILAYFALGLTAVLFDGETQRRLTTAKDHVQRAMVHLFWDPATKQPLGARLTSGQGTPATHPGTFVLSTFLWADIGHPQRALETMDAFDRRYPNPFLMPPQPTNVADARLRLPASPAGVALARRALFPVDSRQQQIALAALMNALRPETAAPPCPPSGLCPTDPVAFSSPAARALLINHPGGFFGIDEGPLLWTPQHSKDLSLPVPTLFKRLDTQGLDTLGALLAHEPSASSFDRLYARLLRLLFVKAATGQGRKPHDWHQAFAEEPYEHRLRQTEQALSTLCEGASLFAAAPVSIEAYLGMPCAQVAQALTALRQERGGNDLARLLEHEDDDLALLELRALLHRTPGPALEMGSDDGMYGHAHSPGFLDASHTTWTSLLSLPVAPLDPTATTDDIRSAIRERLKEAVQASVQNVRGRIFFEHAGVDPIQTFHTASFDDYTRAAVELRVLSTQKLRTGFVFDGQPSSHAPPWPLEPPFRRNVDTFRSWVNRNASGRLADVATPLGLGLPSLHQWMRTGRVSEHAYRRFTDAFETDPDGRFWTEPDLVLEAPPPTREDLHGAVSEERYGSEDDALVIPVEASEDPAPIDEDPEPHQKSHTVNPVVSFPAQSHCVKVYRFETNVVSNEDFVNQTADQQQTHLVKDCHPGHLPFVDEAYATVYPTAGKQPAVGYAVQRPQNPTGERGLPPFVAGVVIFPEAPKVTLSLLGAFAGAGQSLVASLYGLAATIGLGPMLQTGIEVVDGVLVVRVDNDPGRESHITTLDEAKYLAQVVSWMPVTIIQGDGNGPSYPVEVSGRAFSDVVVVSSTDRLEFIEEPAPIEFSEANPHDEVRIHDELVDKNSYLLLYCVHDPALLHSVEDAKPDKIASGIARHPLVRIYKVTASQLKNPRSRVKMVHPVRGMEPMAGLPLHCLKQVVRVLPNGRVRASKLSGITEPYQPQQTPLHFDAELAFDSTSEIDVFFDLKERTIKGKQERPQKAFVYLFKKTNLGFIIELGRATIPIPLVYRKTVNTWLASIAHIGEKSVSEHLSSAAKGEKFFLSVRLAYSDQKTLGSGSVGLASNTVHLTEHHPDGEDPNLHAASVTAMPRFLDGESIGAWDQLQEREWSQIDVIVDGNNEPALVLREPFEPVHVRIPVRHLAPLVEKAFPGLMSQAVIGSISASTLLGVGLSASFESDWTKFVYLPHAPTSARWEPLGTVSPFEIFLGSETLIRENVRIVATSVRGGVDHDGIAFEPNQIYGFLWPPGVVVPTLDTHVQVFRYAGEHPGGATPRTELQDTHVIAHEWVTKVEEWAQAFGEEQRKRVVDAIVWWVFESGLSPLSSTAWSPPKENAAQDPSSLEPYGPHPFAVIDPLLLHPHFDPIFRDSLLGDVFMLSREEQYEGAIVYNETEFDLSRVEVSGAPKKTAGGGPSAQAAFREAFLNWAATSLPKNIHINHVRFHYRDEGWHLSHRATLETTGGHRIGIAWNVDEDPYGRWLARSRAAFQNDRTRPQELLEPGVTHTPEVLKLAVKNVNPTQNAVNCQHCAITVVERLLQGNPFIFAPKRHVDDFKKTPPLVRKYGDHFEDITLTEAVRRLQAAGFGAWAIVKGFKEDEAGLSGVADFSHTSVAVNHEGTLYELDAQFAGTVSRLHAGASKIWFYLGPDKIDFTRKTTMKDTTKKRLFDLLSIVPQDP